MKPIIIINTFKTVVFYQNKKPIVICDIDHTFIKPVRDYKDCYKQLKNDHNNPMELKEIVTYMLKMSMNIGIVRQTDEKGFFYMLQKIKQLGGKLIFLTARSSLYRERTIKDLTTAGLKNPEEFEIHYTGNEISKGDYIKKHNLLQGYDHHIFIDDYPDFLNSALRIYPEMNCYLFKYNK